MCWPMYPPAPTSRTFSRVEPPLASFEEFKGVCSPLVGFQFLRQEKKLKLHWTMMPDCQQKNSEGKRFVSPVAVTASILSPQMSLPNPFKWHAEGESLT